MSNHMNLLECMEWSAKNNFTITIHHTEKKVIAEIDDDLEILPICAYEHEFGSDQNFEKDLATIISDLYFEREEKNEI
jgi:hypothetical protein